MPGAQKGLLATVVSGAIFLAVLAWLLRYASNASSIGKGFAKSFTNFSKAAQGTDKAGN